MALSSPRGVIPDNKDGSHRVLGELALDMPSCLHYPSHGTSSALLRVEGHAQGCEVSAGRWSLGVILEADHQGANSLQNFEIDGDDIDSHVCTYVYI